MVYIYMDRILHQSRDAHSGMKDILELEMNPDTGAQPKLEPIFM